MMGTGFGGVGKSCESTADEDARPARRGIRQRFYMWVIYGEEKRGCDTDSLADQERRLRTEAIF